MLLFGGSNDMWKLQQVLDVVLKSQACSAAPLARFTMTEISHWCSEIPWAKYHRITTEWSDMLLQELGNNKIDIYIYIVPMGKKSLYLDKAFWFHQLKGFLQFKLDGSQDQLNPSSLIFVCSKSTWTSCVAVALENTQPVSQEFQGRIWGDDRSRRWDVHWPFRKCPVPRFDVNWRVSLKLFGLWFSSHVHLVPLLLLEKLHVLIRIRSTNWQTVRWHLVCILPWDSQGPTPKIIVEKRWNVKSWETLWVPLFFVRCM